MITCKCGYQWEPRVPQPKECPKCKRRQDLGKGEKDGQES
jgi:predicted Zn-ribbon and HTH transcriptional regulator